MRQLRRFQPSQLILLDKDENNLYEITCEIREEFEAVVEVIADIRNRDVLEKRLPSVHSLRSSSTRPPTSTCR